MTDKQAGREIFKLSTRYGLVDSYANAPGARRGEYVGIINGKPFLCEVFDRDPHADLAAMRSAIEVALAS